MEVQQRVHKYAPSDRTITNVFAVHAPLITGLSDSEQVKFTVRLDVISGRQPFSIVLSSVFTTKAP